MTLAGMFGGIEPMVPLLRPMIVEFAVEISQMV